MDDVSAEGLRHLLEHPPEFPELMLSEGALRIDVDGVRLPIRFQKAGFPQRIGVVFWILLNALLVASVIVIGSLLGHPVLAYGATFCWFVIAMLWALGGRQHRLLIHGRRMLLGSWSADLNDVELELLDEELVIHADGRSWVCSYMMTGVEPDSLRWVRDVVAGYQRGVAIERGDAGSVPEEVGRLRRAERSVREGP